MRDIDNIASVAMIINYFCRIIFDYLADMSLKSILFEIISLNSVTIRMYNIFFMFIDLYTKEYSVTIYRTLYY